MKVNIGPYPKTEKTKRKISVTIDDYDIWNGDSTLTEVILPLLIYYKNHRNSSSTVDDSDVPDTMKDIDDEEIHHKRWDYVLDKMIFSFKAIKDRTEDSFFTKTGFDKDGWEKHMAEIDTGLILFGKYFRSLWD